MLLDESYEPIQYINDGEGLKVFNADSFAKYEDSSQNKNIIISQNVNLFDTILEKYINETSSDLLSKSSKFQPIAFDSKSKTIYDELKDFKMAVIEKFKTSILSEDLEFGVIGNTTKSIEKFLLINQDYTVNAITQLALDNFDDVNLVYSVLHTLAHVKYDLIAPAGITFALATSRHKNIEIQDFSIQCFDMWESKESLGYLKVIEIDTPWLNDYLQEVITNIESIND